jgi:hypothetical protein
MQVLDENMDEAFVAALARLRIRVRKIGKGVGRAGAADDDLIPLLHRLRAVTFFTADDDFNQPRLCHPRYCLVYLDVAKKDMVETIRKFLRHRAFRTWAQRRGKLMWVQEKWVRIWQVKVHTPQQIFW